MEVTLKMIEDLRLHLEKTAMELGYNFVDPRVVEISQKLDELIVSHMQISKRP